MNQHDIPDMDKLEVNKFKMRDDAKWYRKFLGKDYEKKEAGMPEYL